MSKYFENSNLFESFCEAQIILEQEVEQLERKLKEKKKKLFEFQTRDFVDLMSHYGVNSMHLGNYDVKISNKLYINESGTNNEEIKKFLNDYDASDLIVKSATLYDATDDILDALQVMGCKVALTSKFNVAKVKAFIETLRKEGANIDLQSLGIHEEIKTVVKRIK